MGFLKHYLMHENNYLQKLSPSGWMDEYYYILDCTYSKNTAGVVLTIILCMRYFLTGIFMTPNII